MQFTISRNFAVYTQGCRSRDVVRLMHLGDKPGKMSTISIVCTTSYIAEAFIRFFRAGFAFAFAGEPSAAAAASSAAGVSATAAAGA